MTASSIDRGRITARVPQQVQQTLELAASMVGATVNQFIVQTALREAERIIDQEKFIRLSTLDANNFLNAIDHPSALNSTLLSTIEDYTKRYNDQTDTFNWTPQPKSL